MTLVTAPFAPVEADLQQLSEHLRQLVGGRHPILSAAAEYLFGAGGKHLRPALVLLVARATAGEVIERSLPVPRQETLVSVFIPSTPNPATGWYAMVPERDVVALPITVEEAFKLLISGGIVNPTLGARPETLLRSEHT